MKWIGQHIYDLVSRFRDDVYLEDLTTTTETDVLVVDSTGLVSKSTSVAGDLTAIVAGVGLSGTSLSGPIPTLTLDLSELSVVTPTSGDWFATLDSDGANEQLTSTDALATLFAGAGITASSGVITVDAAQAITSVTADLAINGGDITLGTAGNTDTTLITTITNTGTTAGKDLKISAGSTTKSSNNIDGGDLILSSGGGDGTGTSSIRFNTKVSGTDGATERMRIHTDGSVGIGDTTPIAGAGFLTVNSLNVNPLSITATSGGAAIPDGQSLIICSNDGSANDILILPAFLAGRSLRIISNDRFELRTPDPDNIAINGGTGTNAESAIVGSGAGVIVDCMCLSSTAWACTQIAGGTGVQSAVQVAAP